MPAYRLVGAQDHSERRRGRDASEVFAAGRLSGREEARLAAVIEDAQHAYNAFARAKPFWS